MAADGAGKVKLGDARCPGPSLDDIFDADTRPVPDFMRAQSYEYMGSAPLSTERYTSRAFFEAELEKMWPRVWQMVAREEELPEPGDTVVYKLVDKSFLITRQKDGGVKAFYNVCLHRSRLLRTESGWSKEFKCPFHGFTWNNDGSLKDIPCQWDFGHIKKKEFGLPELRVARWGGYIFVNEDENAPPFEEWAHPLTTHFARWRHEECVTAAWVGKVIPANWKATMEAFMEAWHSVITHPHILPFTGDANTRYDVYGDHMNRALTPFAVLSPHLYDKNLPEQFIVDEFIKSNGRGGETADLRVEVPEGETARKTMAAANRARFKEMFGHDHEHASDSELLDAFTYNVFPNFGPWGGFMPNIVYRWRPWPDQDHCLMEVRLLTRVPPGQPMPRSAQMRFLTDAEPWSAASDLLSPALAGVFDQDMANLPYVQDGMKASKNRKIELGNYQEIRIRHFHRTLDKYLAR
ncbi:MAG: aromatic ring-hydroxylating dioxygenase subunit alpha [Hyphomonadaceae bacterium]|nr:aromatic ring-hydroxylating dioxygenase subunit alpha [Hyphomonadaceae bacterium]